MRSIADNGMKEADAVYVIKPVNEKQCSMA